MRKGIWYLEIQSDARCCGLVALVPTLLLMIIIPKEATRLAERRNKYFRPYKLPSISLVLIFEWEKRCFVSRSKIRLSSLVLLSSLSLCNFIVNLVLVEIIQLVWCTASLFGKVDERHNIIISRGQTLESGFHASAKFSGCERYRKERWQMKLD